MRWAIINDGIVDNVIEMDEINPTIVTQFCKSELAVLSDTLGIGDEYIEDTTIPEPTIEEILLVALLEIQELKQRLGEIDGA